jgi:hypothetical protein
LNGGDPVWALRAITGKPTSEYNINPADVAAAWNAGQLIVLSTPNSPANPNVVGDHAYAVVGYNAANSQPFTIFNPWGPTYPGPEWVVFTANSSFLAQNFDGEFFGTGAGLTRDLTAIDMRPNESPAPVILDAPVWLSQPTTITPAHTASLTETPVESNSGWKIPLSATDSLALATSETLLELWKSTALIDQ